MNSKQRVLAALNHQEADRVPLDIGGINNTTMHVEVQKALKKYLGLKDNGNEIRQISNQVVVPDESVLEYYGADARTIYIADEPWTYDESTGIYTDQWKLGYKKASDGYFYDFVKYPLADVEEIEDLDKYEFFDPCNETKLEGLAERIEKFKDDYCIILEGFREPMFGLPSWLRGHTNFYMDLAGDDGLAEALLDKILDHYFKWIDFIHAKLGSKFDIVKVADDMGSQDNLLCSPATYRRIVKPRQAKLYSYLKEKFGCKLALHSCGAIRSIIPDLIEIGVDVLNPVQISAANMDPAELKKEFGDKITFWGGGVDTQKILNMGSPEDVKREVKKNLEIFKPGGGYVFAQVHNITPDVPVENVVAMYEAFQENAAY